VLFPQVAGGPGRLPEDNMSRIGYKLIVLAVAMSAAVLLGSLKEARISSPAQAALTSPGGIAVLPSAIPGLPGAPGLSPGIEQALPAFAPASGPGSLAIAIAFCDSFAHSTGGCAFSQQPFDLSRGITFTLYKLFPPGGAIDASFASIVANDSGWGQPVPTGRTSIVCTDDASCDLTDRSYEAQQGSNAEEVAVAITGGGTNEVLEVEACDAGGDCRRAQLFFVETVMALFPLGESSAISPHVVTYACPDVGLYTGLADPDSNIAPPLGASSPEVTWEEVYSWWYSTLPWAGVTARGGTLRNTNSSLPLPDIPFYSCGGDTASPVDDRVNFETDAGILSIEALGDGAATEAELTPGVFIRPVASLSVDCDAGDSVDIMDHPGPVLNTKGPVDTGLGEVFPDVPATYCDLDFAPNGVVTYALQGTGDVGVASITTQQSGGGGVLRTINVSFTGRPALSLALEAPSVIGPEGGNFSVAIVDSSFRPLGGETVECSATPKEAVLVLVPQTGTTGGLTSDNPGQVQFTLFPTGAAVQTEVDVTITCAVASNPDVKAISVVRIGRERESLDLLAACNPLASTWPDETPIETVVEAVTPPEALDAVWAFDAESSTWQGYSAAAPEASDLLFVNQLDAISVCMNASGAISRPVI
jgi:hypothetical protein